MEFLAPLMLLGVAGAAVPVVIHLIGRQRAPVIRFAAVDFLLGSNRRVARSLRLRELLLLAARVLVCIAIPLTLAKPFASCTSSGPLVERGPQAAVIVIDNSLASSYEMDGEPLLSRARTRARALLDQMGPEADVAIVLGAEGSPAPEEFSRDHLTLRDQVAGVTSSPRPADLNTALSRAAHLLETSTQARKSVYLLSSLPATGFREGDSPWQGKPAPTLTVIDTADGAALSNLAVVGVEVAPDPNAGSRGVAVVAHVANFGDRAVDDRAIRLRVSEQVLATATVSLRPGERVEKRFAASLPENARVADVVVELDPDALPLDDRRYVRAELRDQVRTLLVDGDPRTVRHDDELFYLETALRPGDRADSGVALTVTTADALAEVALTDYDVVVLANTSALAPERVRPLADWVHAGGGIFITVGDKVDADAYNLSMGELLPQELRDPIATAYGSRGAERESRALRLSKLQLDHPILAVFSEQAGGLGDAEFTRVLLLGPTTRVEERKVLARYTNGAAALIEARSGKGRLLLFTSTVDRDWNDLAIHPAYLPLMQRSVRYLARKQDDARLQSIVIGRSHQVPIPAGTSRVEVISPSGRRTVIEGERVSDRKAVTFSEARRPGFYRVAIAGPEGRAIEDPQAHFAVNLDPRGSDVRRRDEAPQSAGSDSAVVAVRPATDHRRRIELWHAVAVALLGLLLAESVLTARR